LDDLAAQSIHASKVKRAESLITDGHIRRARQALLSTDIAHFSERNLEILQQLHPSRPDIDIPIPNQPLDLPITQADVIRIIRSSSSGAAPDLFHWTAELYKRYTEDEVIIGSLQTLLQHMLQGKLPPSLNDALLASRLITLEKNPGVRPIAIGNLFVKFASKLCCHKMSNSFQNYFHPIQFAVGESAGAEKIIHCVQSSYEAGQYVCKVDFRNAFNCVFRHVAIQQTSSLFPEIANFLTWAYTPESPLIWNSDNDTNILKSSSGSRQGDPLGPFVFCVVLQPLLLKLLEHFPDVKIFAYMDDVHLVGEYSSISDCFAYLQRLCSVETGLEIRPDKCLLLHSSGLTPVETPLKCVSGASILGSPVGDRDFCHSFALKQVSKCSELLSEIVSLKSQSAMLMLRDSFNHKLNHLIRKTPPSLISEAAMLSDQFQ
jgi:hypothetical protein